MYNVLIGVCSGGTLRAETVTSLIGAMEVLKNNGVTAGLAIQIGGYVARNRNELVQTARDKGCSHIMFIDNDMTFPPSAIQRLVDADKDIVCAPYNARPAPGKTVVSTLKLLNDKGKLDLDGKQRAFELVPGLVEIGAAGTGFMLIKLSVFDKLKKPYFVAWETPEGDHHTEDIEFCIRAREAGFAVYCNSTIPIGHIGNATF